MGDMGTVSMASINLAGIGTIQDMVPNGGEQPWDDLMELTVHLNKVLHHLTLETDLVIVLQWVEQLVSAAINYENNSAYYIIAVQLPNLVEGLNVGAGIATDASAAGVEDDIETMYVKYTMGGISVGYQITDVEQQLQTTDIERTAYGISFAVNDNLSIGYGISDTEFEQFSYLDEENAGIGIAYTSGGMKLGIINNTKDNAGGSAGADEMTELQLTFAF